MGLSLFCAHLSDVDMEVTDWIVLECLFALRHASDCRQSADVVALEQAMQ
jgi:hypothetical protein